MHTSKFCGWFALLAAVIVTGTAQAACVTAASTVTCTGGTAAHVATSTTAGVANSGTSYPATIAVSGVPGGSTVATVTLRLNGYTARSSNTSGNCASILCGSSRDAGILLQSPDGRNLQVLRAVGTAGSNASAITVTIQDGGTVMPNQSGTGVGAFNATGTYRPTANVGRVGVNPSYSPGPAIINNASDSLTAPIANQTLNGVFVGASVNGTWNEIGRAHV